jgi:hypothetical protein
VTRIAEDVAGLSQLLALLAEHGNGAPAALTSLSRDRQGVVGRCAGGSRVHRVPDQSPGRGSLPRAPRASGG